MDFLFNDGENRIYNNSIINDIYSEQVFMCKSIFGNSRLKFSSDNETLNAFFNEEDYNNPTSFNEATNITVRNISDYEIQLIVEGELIDGNITCYSEESGE